jgi:hypothetical protein
MSFMDDVVEEEDSVSDNEDDDLDDIFNERVQLMMKL